MISDPAEDIGEPSLSIYVIELGGFDRLRCLQERRGCGEMWKITKFKQDLNLFADAIETLTYWRYLLDGI